MSERKINLEEIIKEELYNKHLYFNKMNTVQIKNICLEFGKQLLELAAENADYGVYQNDDGQEPWIHESNIFIDKQSILDTINQIEMY